MKFILDIEQVVREMNISPEAYAAWKAANLNLTADRDARWTSIEDNGFVDRSHTKPHDLKLG